MVFQYPSEPTILDNSLLCLEAESKMIYKEKSKIDLSLQFLERRKFRYKFNIGKLHYILEGQPSGFLHERMSSDSMFEVSQCDKYPINIWRLYGSSATKTKVSKIVWSLSDK